MSSLAAVDAPEYPVRRDMPGLIDTHPWRSTRLLATSADPASLTRDEYAAQCVALVPMRYEDTAMDVAFAAPYFASDESRYVSVAVLPGGGAVLAR